MIRITVSYGSYQLDISVPAQSTLGDLKRVLAHETGLEPEKQRLLFGGKEMDDEESLQVAGVTEMSKVVLVEEPDCKERKLEETKRKQCKSEAYRAVAVVREDVDKLSDKVAALERSVHRGTKVAEKEFVALSELLMLQLLKLDSIEAEGEAKVQRRIEVGRIQGLLDALDNLKMRNSMPVATEWEAFAPTPRLSTKITEDWELFD
ncbi:hypothetical protein NMG60_11014465 [Bertholletia excelsa]